MSFSLINHSPTSSSPPRVNVPLVRLKDCQAWYVNDQNLCKKRELIATDATELAGYLRFCYTNIHLLRLAFDYQTKLKCALRYDAINKMIGMLAEEITVNKGRAAYAGKVILVVNVKAEAELLNVLSREEMKQTSS